MANAITLTPCTSSYVQSHGHCPQTNTLRVEFRGGKVFDYAGVDAQKYSRMCSAESLGKFIHAEIKGKHDVTPYETPAQTPAP